MHGLLTSQHKSAYSIQRIFFNRSRSSRSLESTLLDSIWPYLPSTISFCLFRNQSGILNCVGFCMMFTIRSSSSEFRSPALTKERKRRRTSANDPAGLWVIEGPHRFFKSTSAFLHTMLEYRRPTPLISVKAYLCGCLISAKNRLKLVDD
jgi:hypothetical protein